MSSGLPSLNPRGAPPPGPGAGAQAYGRLPSVIPSQPGGQLLQQVASLFGSTSPQEAIRQRNQGIQPTLTAQPNTPQQGLPPEQAGVVQSAAPGLQNGNEANGFHDPLGSAVAQQPGLPQGQPGMPPLPTTGLPGLPPLPGQMPAPMPQQQPQPTQGSPYGFQPGNDPFDMIAQIASQFGIPQPTFDDPYAPGLPGATGVQDLPGPAKPQAQDPLLGLSPAEEFIRANSMQTIEPTPQNAATPIAAPPDDTPDTNRPWEVVEPGVKPAPGTGSFNSNGVRTGTGFKNWKQAGWDSTQNVPGGEKTNAKLAFIENSDGGWTNNFWQKAFGTGGVTGSTRALPKPSEATNYGITLDGSVLPDSIFDTVDNTGVQDLLRKWEGWSSRLSTLEQEGGVEKDRGTIQELNEKLKIAEAALGQYGITANASGEHPDAPGTPDDVFGNDDTRADADPFKLYEPDAGVEPKLVTQMFGPRAGRNAQDNAAAAELAMQILTDDAQRGNQQLGVNELVRSINDFQSSDLFGGIQDQARTIAGQDNFDFNGIRNQAVADQNQSFNSAMQNLGASAASRGLGSASMSGLAGELGHDNAASLARLLGDINLQEQQSARDFQLQGLGALQSSFGSTEGPLAQLRQQLAGALGAPVGQTFNPAGGALDASAGLLALDQAQQGLDLASDSARTSKYLGMADAFTGLLGLIPGLGGGGGK